MYYVEQSNDAVGSWYVVSVDGDFIGSYDSYLDAQEIADANNEIYFNNEG